MAKLQIEELYNQHLNTVAETAKPQKRNKREQLICQYKKII